MTRKRPVPVETPNDDAEAVAAFIRSRGVTRCPTACAAATQASLAPADRAALQRYGKARERLREARQANSAHGPAIPQPGGPPDAD